MDPDTTSNPMLTMSVPIIFNGKQHYRWQMFLNWKLRSRSLFFNHSIWYILFIAFTLCTSTHASFVEKIEKRMSTTLCNSMMFCIFFAVAAAAVIMRLQPFLFVLLCFSLVIGTFSIPPLGLHLKSTTSTSICIAFTLDRWKIWMRCIVKNCRVVHCQEYS